MNWGQFGLGVMTGVFVSALVYIVVGLVLTLRRRAMEASD
jgi:hypothetical protein